MSQIKLALRNLTRHRLRTAISLAAIVFGVVAFMIAGGFIEYIFWAMREAAIQSGLGHIQVTRPGFRDSGFADPNRYLLPAKSGEIARLRAMPGVKAVDERLLLNGLASHGETTIAFMGEAVNPAANHAISTLLTVRGEALSADHMDGVLLGRGLARALGVKVGDRVTFIVSLPKGGINAVEGIVRGTFATEVKSYDDSAVRMPIDLGRRLMRVDGAHEWVVGLDDTDQTASAMAAIRSELPSDRFAVASWRDLSDFYRKAVALLSRQVDILGILIALIILLGISNTLTMNVLERTGEIGTLMAMGNRRSAILRLFLLEGTLLGIAGGVIGLVLGFVLAELLSAIGIPMPPPPGRDTGYSAQIMLTGLLACSAFLLAAIATALASIYPAWRAARLPIVDALRHNR